jgi:hypothetical protein
MQIINTPRGQTPPGDDEFVPVGFYGVIGDIRVCLNILDREWCDREARARLIGQIESAARALGCLAAGREVLRAFNESGDVYYAYEEES